MSGIRPVPRWLAPALWLAFAIIAVAVKADLLVPIDTRLILGLRGILPDLVTPLRGASFLAGNGAAVIGVAIALVIGWRHGKARAWRYTGVVLGGWAVNLILKQLIQHARPNGISPKLTEAGWFSFPSGHAMLGAILFAWGAWEIADGMKGAAKAAVLIAGAGLTFLVGLSRIYLGAHWPSDVLAAWIAALAWILVGTRLLARREPVPA